MNRKDFKSAYDKITLSDECRAEMKNKLMAAMEQKNSSGEFEDDGLLHSTQEIKLAPRKRSAGNMRFCSAMWTRATGKLLGCIPTFSSCRIRLPIANS